MLGHVFSVRDFHPFEPSLIAIDRRKAVGRLGHPEFEVGDMREYLKAVERDEPLELRRKQVCPINSVREGRRSLGLRG